MKRAVFVALALSLCTLPARSADPKLLHSMKGEVSYQKSAAALKPLALQARVALEDSDTAVTGGESLAEVLLPDTTKVTMGADSKVQMEFFNQAEGTKASFILFNGKTRFSVAHPGGAPANYTFKTPTAQIAVRGTDGDIGVSDDELDINVYHLGDASLPVEVTTKDGKTFKLVGGQSFVAQIVNGIIQTKVEALKQEAIDRFSGDFGVPTSIDQLKNQAVNELRKRLPF